MNPNGRPKLDKVKHRLSFSKKASSVIGKRAQKLGVDRSDYIESLVRQDNPKDFPNTVFSNVLTSGV